MVKISQKVANVLDRKRPVKYLAMRALKASRLCTLFRIEREGFSLRFYPSALSGELWYDPDLRLSDELFFKSYLRSGDVVIDVGANIGGLTLQASVAVGQGGRVVAIEAHPRTFSYLRGNVSLNRADNVQMHNCAVGNDDGTISFSNQKLDDGNAVARSGECIQVTLCRLDSLSIEATRIDLLKIDVEGFEKFVFEGAEQILAKTQCIYFESWEDHFQKYDYCSSDVFALLNRSGFTVYKMAAPDTVEPLAKHHQSSVCEDLVAVRDIGDFVKRTNFTVKD